MKIDSEPPDDAPVAAQAFAAVAIDKTESASTIPTRRRSARTRAPSRTGPRSRALIVQTKAGAKACLNNAPKTRTIPWAGLCPHPNVSRLAYASSSAEPWNFQPALTVYYASFGAASLRFIFPYCISAKSERRRTRGVQHRSQHAAAQGLRIPCSKIPDCLSHSLGLQPALEKRDLPEFRMSLRRELTLRIGQQAIDVCAIE
jgi:hypothetical protein